MTDYREVSAVLGCLGELLVAAREQRGATLREIERRTGITNSNVLRILRGENCTVKHARALLAWLDDPDVTKEQINTLLEGGLNEVSRLPEVRSGVSSLLGREGGILPFVRRPVPLDEAPEEGASAGDPPPNEEGSEDPPEADGEGTDETA